MHNGEKAFGGPAQATNGTFARLPHAPPPKPTFGRLRTFRMHLHPCTAAHPRNPVGTVDVRRLVQAEHILTTLALP